MKSLSKTEEHLVKEYLNKLASLNKFFKPAPWQQPVIKAIFKDGFKLVFICAGRSSGKTFSTKYILFRSAYCFPGTSNYMIGPTRKQQAEIAWEQSDGLPNFLPLSKMGGQAKNSEHRVEFASTGSFIKLDGSEEYYSYRGVPFHIMVLDEWQNQDPRFLEAAYPNLFKRKEAVLIIIGHPSSAGANHFDAKYEEAKRDPRWFVQHATCFDNPYLDRIALELEKQAYINRGELYEWLCEYEAKRTAGGKRAVFPMFSEERHVRPRDVILAEIERDKNKLAWGIGLDPGSAVCFAGCVAAYNEQSGKVYILDEVYEKSAERTSTGVIWPSIQEKRNKLIPSGIEPLVVYDEAAAWFAGEVAQQYGEGVTPSNKAQNDKENGLSLIKDLMVQDKFVIASECVNGIHEITHYSREEDGKIKKKADHCFAGETIVHTKEGPTPISQLVGKSGELLSRGGIYRPFHNCRVTDTNCEALHITFEDGDSVTVTPEHPLLSIDGSWIVAEAINVETWIEVVNAESYSYSRTQAEMERQALVEKQKQQLLQELKPKYFEAFAQACLGVPQWAYPQGLPYPPHRWGYKQQRDRKLGNAFAKRTRGKTLVGRKVTGTSRTSSSDSTSYERMAPLPRGYGMAPPAREECIWEPPFSFSKLQLLWQRIQNEAAQAFSILPSKLQNEGENKKVKSVERITLPAVYNLEVDVSHALVVNGGLVTHNCLDAMRYLLAGLGVTAKANVQTSSNLLYTSRVAPSLSEKYDLEEYLSGIDEGGFELI